MQRLTQWVQQLLASLRPFRFRILLGTLATVCLLSYISFKSMVGKSIHALSGLYAADDEATVTAVRTGKSLFSPWLAGLELGIDTLFFIPCYALALLLYAEKFQKQTISKLSQSNWFNRLLIWLTPWLPLLVGVGVVADLVENGYLVYWAISNHMPLTPTTLTIIRVLKFVPLGIVSGYVLLGFTLSGPVKGFIIEISGSLWFVFKAITLNKFVRCGVAMLRTVWPICVVLVITYLFLNAMDQARDLLYSLVNDLVYSICVFACLLLFAISTWYSARIIFILRDQRNLVESIGPKDPDKEELAHYLQTRTENNRWMHDLPMHRIIDSDTLRTFTRWTPVVLGLIPFFSFMTALGKIEGTAMHQLALVAEILVYLGLAYQVKNYVDNTTADDSNIHPHQVSDLRMVHRQSLRTGLGCGILLVVLATIWRTNLWMSSLLGPVAMVLLALTMWVMIASLFTYFDYRYKAPFTVICLLIMMFLNNNNHQIRTIDPASATGSYFSKDKTTQSIPRYFDQWLEQLMTDTGGAPSGTLAKPLALNKSRPRGPQYW